MSNLPGISNALPGVFTDVETLSSGVAIPGGSRVIAMIGQGSVNETIISQAQGGGLDGLNPTYTNASGADGRHFALQNFPLIKNRTTIFKNGIPLVGQETLIDTNPFSFKFDYRLDTATGHIELQAAHIFDQGGQDYVPVSTNVGLGAINSLTLEDANAPPEIWTIRCVGVQRNAMNQPIQETAKFLAFGSVSGTILDANGNPIVWVSNGTTVSNGILSFNITETQISDVSTAPFVQGDAFTIIVKSGVLVRGDTLTSNEIPTININLPTLTQGMNDVNNYSGPASLTNNLSLGAQLAYANGASSLIAVMAAPPLPRRTSYILDPVVNSLSTNPDDFIFPLPIGVVPDFNSDIHVFVTDPNTLTETQILPNKFPYYELDQAGQPTTSTFIFSDDAVPAGYSYSYTVKQSFEELETGFDGYIARDPSFTNRGIFSSSVTFDSTYIGTTLKIIDANNVANIGSFVVTAVNDGDLYVTATLPFGDFTTETGETFELIDPTTLLPVDGYAGTDGTLTNLVSTGTATLHSVSVNFNGVVGLTSLKIKINGSTHNDGLYDINSYNSGSNTLTIGKAFVVESNLRYEVLDTDLESNYIVLNHNVVPNGNQVRVTIVDTRDADFFDAGWINALASLEPVECDILVVLPNQTISVIFQNALNHCLTMSNILNRKERVLFLGAIQGLTPQNLTGAKLAAVENIGILEGIQGATVTDVLDGNVEDLANYSVPNAFGETYRAVYFYPDQIVVQAGASNVLIDGFYLAAAAAGYENADVRLENPLTNKVLSGFTILQNKAFSVLTLQSLAAAGVTTLQPVSGGGRVIWGITTSQSGFPEEQEISIVFIRDRIAKTLRAGLAGFIGTPQKIDTLAVINTNAIVLLNSLVSQGIITAYKNLTVIQDDVDPRQIDISVQVAPTYPLNTIFCKVFVGNLANVS